MRWLSTFIGLLSLFVATSVVAQEPYRLQPGDTVEIWVAEEEDLRRTAVIGPDGSFSFPLAGHVKAQGMTVEELETALRQRLAGYYKDALSLTAMLQANTAAQPTVFIAGEVSTPGEYRFRDGMTVLHAVSLAGGLYRQAIPPADQDRAILVERDIKLAENRLDELGVLTARLQAELDGKTVVVTDQVSLDSPLLAQEQKVLDDRHSLQSDQEARQQEAVAMQGRIAASARSELETVQQRVVLAQKRLDSTTELVAKGAAQAVRQFEQESEVATLRGLVSELTTGLLTAEQLATTEVATFEREQKERRTQLHAEIVAAQREQSATRARLADSRSILSIYAERQVRDGPVVPQLALYSIVRATGGEMREIAATEMTPILANDLVRVVYRPAVSGSPADPSVAEADRVGLLTLGGNEISQ